jgi:xanthine dehydrogenase accessory factor
MNPLIIIRGGGDLASGVALRLHRAGFQTAILELPKPLAVRRTVSFANAVYEKTQIVEGVTARLASADQIMVALELGEIPVLIDPDANILRNLFVTSPQSTIVIDARLLKSKPEKLSAKLALYIGLGPGFIAGEDCDAVIETQRGHTLGRVYWKGSAHADNRLPDGDPRRVLRAPSEGRLIPRVQIGAHLEEGQPIAEIQSVNPETGIQVNSPFKGILRGLIHQNVEIKKDMKIGDVDVRDDPALCTLVSDKALAVGGGALEAVLAFIKDAAI